MAGAWVSLRAVTIENEIKRSARHGIANGSRQKVEKCPLNREVLSWTQEDRQRRSTPAALSSF